MMDDQRNDDGKRKTPDDSGQLNQQNNKKIPVVINTRRTFEDTTLTGTSTVSKIN